MSGVHGIHHFLILFLVGNSTTKTDDLASHHLISKAEPSHCATVFVFQS